MKPEIEEPQPLIILTNVWLAIWSVQRCGHELVVRNPKAQVNPEIRRERELVDVDKLNDQIARTCKERRLGSLKPKLLQLLADVSQNVFLV